MSQVELFASAAPVINDEQPKPEPELLAIPEMTPVSARSPALDSLLNIASEAVADYTGTRRPTWAPALTLEGEIVTVLRELGWMKSDDKDVARLWARYTDPKRGPVRCVGFELRAGASHTGYRFFESGRRSSGEWSTGPTWLPPRAYIAEWRTEAIKRNEAWAKRYPLAVRATELGAIRVAEFAGQPDEQMRLGALLTGACSCCGRGLTDPISIERGIGPECWGGYQRLRHAMAKRGAK
jgi:hypothetical protein